MTNLSKPLKILFIGVFENYFRSTNTSQLLCFKKLGHEIVGYNYREKAAKIGILERDKHLISTVKENKFDDQKIRSEYNANYIIQGSVQSFGKNKRLTLELNDLSKNSVFWSKKVDFKLDDIFKVQDNIGMQILEELQVKAVVGQQAATWFEEFGFETFEQYTLFLNIRREGRKGTHLAKKYNFNYSRKLFQVRCYNNII